MAFSPNLKANLHEAARLSLFFNAKLSLIHVGEESDEKRNQVKDYLSTFMTQSLEYSLDFKSGTTIGVILNHINDKKIDLMILGARFKEKSNSYYVGYMARKLTRTATCSILLLIKPSVMRKVCQHIVVNGVKATHTARSIQTAFYVAGALETQRITIVEEITKNQLSIKADDDKTLRKASLQREKLRRQEDARIDKFLEEVPAALKNNVTVAKQSIFGKRGYSIGHYAQISHADLLVMNAPGKEKLWNRLIPHDIDHILKELPTDVLIVR